MTARSIRAAGFLLAALSLFACRSVPAGGPPPGIEPDATYAVIIGVLEWKSESLSSFSKDNRRDRALYERLRQMGVPAANMRLLLDREATAAAMAGAIETVAQSAPKGATFIFYYAGHGYPSEGAICLANYDAGAGGGEGFPVDRITTLLKRCFKGDRVLLFGDCCYSGGLAKAAAELSREGFACASLTAASDATESTGQWTFSCNLLDAFEGRPLFDTDGDGVVSLSETAHAVTEAMTFVEKQHSGFSLHGLDGSFRISRVDPEAVRPVDGPIKTGRFVKVGKSGKRRTARVIDYRNGKVAVEVQRYHDRVVSWHPADRLVVMDRPRLRKVKPDEELGPEAARKKARVDGKYSDLVRVVPARHDYRRYGAFHDYGFSRESSYAGEHDIPPGYWVYVYPRWYVFREKP